MTFNHPTTAQQLAQDRRARLVAQSNARRRIRRLGRRVAACR
jgi:hypothetical protein